jgi:Flp pilus assembly protein TadD
MNTRDTRYDRATFLFDGGDYIAAARELVDLVADHPESTDARVLLARAYYHSAQLGRAERELRTIVADNPVDAYAQLLLGRTLQRQSRHDEAGPHLRLAGAMGAEL